MRATKRDTLLQLTPTQQDAVELLLAGKCDRETAEAVGVARTTVTRWRLYHPAFQAELNARRRELKAATSDRLLSLRQKAIDALEAELTGGPKRFSAAVQILKATDQLTLPAGDADCDPEALLAKLVKDRASVLRKKREESIPFTDLAFMTPTAKEIAADLKEAEKQIRAELLQRLGNDADVAE